MGGLDPPIQRAKRDKKMDGRLKAGHGELRRHKEKRRRKPAAFSYLV